MYFVLSGWKYAKLMTIWHFQSKFCSVSEGENVIKKKKKKKEKIITEFDFFFLSWSVKLGYFKERRALGNSINAIATGSTYLKYF